jgi:hypothetical protein
MDRRNYNVAVAAVDRRIWATPAASYDDILARAELAEFWNRGWDYYDHHGYEDCFANKRLADCVLIDRPERPLTLAFEPPAPLLERRRLNREWCRRYGPHTTNADREQHFHATFEIDQALLAAITPARSWSDVVIRAELHMGHGAPSGMWRTFDEERGDDCRLLKQRSFGEFLVAILALGGVPPPPRYNHSFLDRLPILPEPDDEDDEIES